MAVKSSSGNQTLPLAVVAKNAALDDRNELIARVSSAAYGLLRLIRRALTRKNRGYYDFTEQLRYMKELEARRGLADPRSKLL